MQYVYGAMLLHASGKPIDENTVTQVLTAAGAQPDPARIKALVASLQGVNIDEILAKAETLAGATPAATAAPSSSEKKEEKKEAKDEKEDKGVSEEEAAAGLSALFG